jgi:hypothetical protein
MAVAVCAIAAREAAAQPVLGLTAFVDHTWNPRWSSSAGYSLVDIDNRGNFADGFTVNDVRLQFSFKFSFSTQP